MADDEQDPPEVFDLTADEAANLVGKTRRTIDRWVNKGKLQKKRGKLSRAQLEELIEASSNDPALATERALQVMTDQVTELTKLSIEERRESRQAFTDALGVLGGQLNALSESRERELKTHLEILDQFGKFLLREKEQEALDRQAELKAKNLQRAWEGLEKMMPHLISRVGADSKTVDALKGFSTEELKELKGLLSLQGDKAAGLVGILDSVLKMREQEETGEEPKEGGADGDEKS